MTQANQIILQHKFGSKELANYGLSIQIITIIRLLQTQLLRLTAPSIADVTNAEWKAPSVIKKLLRYSALTFGLSVCIVLPMWILTPFLIEKFMGKDYITAIPVLNVLYVWAVLYGIAIINNQFLIGLHLQRFFFISTSIFGLISLLLSELFVDRYRSMGAALSLLISHLCSVIFQFFIVLQKIKQHARSTS